MTLFVLKSTRNTSKDVKEITRKRKVNVLDLQKVD